MEGLQGIQDLRLIHHFNDMYCYINFAYGELLNCEVNRSYFRNEKTGYYYTYHHIVDDVYSIFYDLSPIQVIIPDDKRIYIEVFPPEDRLILGQNGTIFLETDYNHKENNILNRSDIEENIFQMRFDDAYWDLLHLEL